MDTDVIIVGAGAAGLTAAKAVAEGGAECVVLEARGRAEHAEEPVTRELEHHRATRTTHHQ